jgi:hypothetical protein
MIVEHTRVEKVYGFGFIIFIIYLVMNDFNAYCECRKVIKSHKCV